MGGEGGGGGEGEGRSRREQALWLAKPRQRRGQGKTARGRAGQGRAGRRSAESRQDTHEMDGMGWQRNGEWDDGVGGGARRKET